MAAGTTSPETSPARQGVADPFGSQAVAYDRYIETQLHRTRRQVKGVDVSSSMMLLVVAALVYLMLVALLDHWVVKGGLSVAGRMVAFAVLAAGGIGFGIFKLFPLAMRRVNPVYAAYAIEQHRPGLKNSLINFLLLRSGSDRLPDKIYQAMEAQAANALSSSHPDVAVDRTPLIRLLLALVAVVFCVALYAVVSPKNPFTSFRRVVSPWSDVAPPTRVLIHDIQPGDASGFHDQHVAVSAQIDGVRPGEPIVVRYSTVDGQVMSRAVPMAKPENAYRYAAELPPDNLGLQQDLEYWIEAGDAFSPHYKIKVDTAPTIVVEEIEYQYPKYAELPSRKVARHGDIQALAGTRVTLRAKSNQPIRQANLDFECDGRNDLDMQVDGTRATVSFPLAWSDTLRRAEHESYQLRFRNQDGHENPKPIRYTIEVIRDLPPEVELVEPELDPSKDLVVPAGKPVRFAVQAADPDFKLAAVKFQARRGRTPLVEESLLAEPRGGQFRRVYLLDLKRLEVKPGEQIEFWAAADDNRQPTANHSETPHYRLRIGSPDQNDQGQGDQTAQNPDQKGQSKPDDQHKKQTGNRNNENREGDEGDDEGQQRPDNQNKPGGKSKEGKKSERQKQQGDDTGEQESSEAGQDGQRGPSDKPQTGDGNSSEEKSNEDKSDSGGDQSGQGQTGGKEGGEKGGESKRVDPERDAGKAIDEINKYFNDKNKDEKNEGDKNKDNKNKDDANRDSKRQDGQQPGENKTPDQSGGKPGKKEDRQQKEGSQSEGDKQGGQSGKQTQPAKSASEPKEKQPRSEQGENGEGQNGDQKQTRTGQKQSGKQSGDQRQTGEEQAEGSDPAGADAKEQQPKPGDERKGTKQQPGQSKGDKTEQTQEAGKPQDKNQSEDGQQGDKKKQGENGALADKQNDQKGGPGEQAGSKDQGDEKQGDKQGAKNGKKPSKGEKGESGDKQGVANEGSDKSEKDKTGDGKQGEAKEGDEQPKQADGESHPRDGQGGKSEGAGEPDDKVKKHKGESPDQKGGDPDSKDKGEGGAGDSEGANKHGAPAPQNETQDRKKKQVSPDAKKGTSEDKPESPGSKSNRKSDSQGGEDGDRTGGGKSGGGQRSNSEGTGSAGMNSEADEGGGEGETKGKGPTGEKGGDQQKSDKPTGGKPSGEKGSGSNQGQGQESDKGRKAESPDTADPRGHNNASSQPGQPNRDSEKSSEKQPPNGKRPPAPQNKDNKKQTDGAPQHSANNEAVDGAPTPSDRGGHDLRGGKGRGNPTGGGEPGPDETTPPEEIDDSEPGGDDPNLEYARKATDLALDRLKDQLAKDKPDPELLNKLKWSPEDIKRFVQQWERLKKAADEAGPKGDAARQELDDTLRSLGLRQRGSSLAGGEKHDDGLRHLREGRRTSPPPEYQDQYIEFNKARAKGTK